MNFVSSHAQSVRRASRLPQRSNAARCHAQPTDTSRLAGKSERSRVRRRRQGPQQAPQPADLPQERRTDMQDMPSVWLEDQEQEEAELDSMRAAEAPGNASAEQPPSSSGAAAPPFEPPTSSSATARSQAAVQRESELSGGFGAPPPEVAMSPQDQRRWEAFIQEVNPYDFPVRTMDEMGEAEAAEVGDCEDEDSDDDDAPPQMVQMADFTDRLSGAPAAAEAPAAAPESRSDFRSRPQQGTAADASTQQQQQQQSADLRAPAGVAADFPVPDYMSAPSTASKADAQGDEETRRRGAVLMRLIGAGDQLDTLLGLHAEDIDEQLLEMLYSRIQLAVRDGESEENVDALTTLWRRLRAEAERAAASPVERLLDDVLLLQNAPMNSEERKRQDVESRLAAAFKPLGSRAVDVFAMAEALSQRDSSGSTGSGILDDIVEFVPKADFLAQVQKMLDEALEANKQIEARLTSLSREEALIVGEALKDRQSTAKQVQVVLDIAKDVPEY